MKVIALCHDCRHQHGIDVAELRDGVLAWRVKHLGHRTELVLPSDPWQEYDPNADIYPSYAASSNEATLTALNSLAASSTHIAGWEGTAIDNTGSAPRKVDFRVTAKITVSTSPAPTAGEIKLWLVGMLDDSTWPDVFDGTASAETVTSVEIRDAICKLAAVTKNDTTASRAYYLDCPSAAAVFGGNLPAKFVPFITQNTGQNLGSTGNQVTVKGNYFTSA